MRTMHKSILAALVALTTLSAHAQQVNTLYFLENAPMRHTINPAFQPVSQGFVNITPLGWMSFGVGNNSLTLSDVLFVDNVKSSASYGMTITPVHPDANRQAFLRGLRSMIYFNGEATIGMVNVGVRIKDAGYLTVGINERIDAGMTVPKSIFTFALDGMMKDIDGGNNRLDLSGIGTGASAYMEISGGYSHKLNEQWTLGGKLKVLLGQAYVRATSRNMTLDASTQEWHLYGKTVVDVSGPLDVEYLAPFIDGKNALELKSSFKDGGFDTKKLINTSNFAQQATPVGYGAAIDFGFTYKPIEQVQISAALNDLGFIYWTKTASFTANVDTTFTGIGTIDYGDPKYLNEEGKFEGKRMLDDAVGRLEGMLNNVRFARGKNGAARMITTRLNIGVDANFWDNRVGVGLVSATRLYNARLYEELTIGAAFRPVNWFNIALSYSLMNNGKYSNIGAGLSLMPYDGINMTLIMDYIPTSYAALPTKDSDAPKQYLLPDKSKMFNIALGFSICWGTNRRDKDKDGVWDKIDMCPNTPAGVAVDSVGCPLDEDHDGVPDYLDHCLGTPEAAIGFVDSVGCPLDTDSDGVADYLDQCANTPAEAIGYVDSLGCPLDTDGDGVYDYMDECPNTPEAAIGHTNEFGCEADTDGDGVPDYLDECPNTPEAAYGTVDDKGCPKDGDGDGVYDYLDECPDTPIEAIGYVDDKGCELDSDNDGVPDYKDECPLVAGVKANKGCPEIKREVRKLLEKAMQGIEFESGKATIKSKSYALLDQIAQTFIENDNYIIEVQGHTDATGKAEANKKLSQQRADAVMLYLARKGVADTRMTAVGYGQEMPIADNTTKAGRQKNRRVEFKITFEEVHIETILDHADQPELNNE